MKKTTKYLLMCFLLSLMLAGSQKAFAQTDTEFWFAAPKVAEGSIYGSTGFNTPILLRISTLNAASMVTVTQPANPAFVPRVVNIAANAAATVDLTANIATIQNEPADNVNNWGLKITATTPITVYYEVASLGCIGCNPEMFSLKGNNALGTSFYTPFQNVLNNGTEYVPTPYSAFDIVATQDNTTVTITPTRNIVGHLAGIPFQVTLNTGQTYSAQATSQLAADHLGGSKVTSDKPIAITIKDDLARGGALYGGDCDDLIGDQVVPESKYGFNYAVVRGYLSPVNPEKAFIVAAQDNTTINVAGTNMATINAGQTYVADITQPSTYITSTKPTILLHMSGFDCETAGAILPPLDCNGAASGSPQVAFVRSSNQPFFANILVRTTLINNFLFNGAAGVITAADFSAVPNTNGAYSFARIALSLAQLPAGGNGLISNTAGVFQLGIIHGGVDPATNLNSGVRYAYFSDFKNCTQGSFTNTVKTTNITCFGQDNGTATLTVTGGIAPFTYTLNGPVALVDAPFTSSTSTIISNLKPGGYSVTVKDAANSTTPLQNFQITQPANPLTASITGVNANCNNGGSITITPSGGTAPYTITGTDVNPPRVVTAGNSTTFNNLVAKNYSYTITDANGCTISKNLAILKDNNCNEICYESPTKPAIVNAKSTWTVDPIAGTVKIKTTLAKTFVDNTYGNQTIGWPNNSHSFSNLVGSDQLQLALYDASNVKRLEFQMDYISLSGGVYKSLGVTGGDGSMILGTATNVLDVNTSEQRNLSLYPGTTYTTNSPATDANYTPNPAAPNWIYDVWYEVTVKLSAFPGGFGNPMITGVHASPSKTGSNTEIVNPGPCPGPLSLGNKVWIDKDDNGLLNGTETGVSGLTIKLYKDTDGNNIPDAAAIATTTTGAGGTYLFDKLQAGRYIVGVMVSANYLPANNAVGVPDNDVDNDNNGVNLVSGELRTNAITLSENGEPVTDGDGNNGNLTLDIAIKEGPQDALCDYNVIAITQADFYDYNNLNGNVGVTSSTGIATFKKFNNVIPGFVKASVITADPTSNIPNKVFSPAVITLPAVNYYTGTPDGYANLVVAANSGPATYNGNYKDVTIGKNAKVTLTGTDFRKIVVPEGAELTLTASNIDIREFVVAGTATNPGKVFFTSNASCINVKISYKAEIGYYAEINKVAPKPLTFTMAVQGKSLTFNVKKGSYVNANIYVPLGTLSVDGYNDATTTMIGTYIAEKIDAGKYINWLKGNCCFNSSSRMGATVVEAITLSPATPMLSVVSELPEKFSVTVMPNPTRSQFTMQIKSNSQLPGRVRLTDEAGRLIRTFSNLPSNHTFSFGNELKKGAYFAEIIQGEERKIIKLVKM